MFNGLLLVDKEKGWTSHDVVAKIRGILARAQLSVVSDLPKQTTDNRQLKTRARKVKVGHTGTLDPLATGLMVVVVGSYCKRAQEFSKLDKVYEVTMKLGLTSSTGDEEGEKTKKSDHQPSESDVSRVIEQFIGETEQTPPIFSAIKVDGKRAYQLAREGKEVKLEPRKVTIHSMTGISYSYPEVKFTVHVSSGTYIRSLVEDIGSKLETGAYMSDLRRTKVGEYSLEQAFMIEQLQGHSIAELLEQTA